MTQNPMVATAEIKRFSEVRLQQFLKNYIKICFENIFFLMHRIELAAISVLHESVISFKISFDMELKCKGHDIGNYILLYYA